MTTLSKQLIDMPARVLTYTAFPLIFFGALGFAIHGIKLGHSHKMILASIAFSTAFVLFVLEKVHPEHPEWLEERGDVGIDIWHNIISQLLLPELLKLGVLALFLGLAQSLSVYFGGTLWPVSISLFWQLCLAMVLSQFGEYWLHRAMHEHPFLWRFHAVHHSPGRLYWLNAGRFHPVDLGLSYLISAISMTLLGAPPEILLLMAVWAAVHGLFQHCNVQIRLGPLNWIFSNAELHRWHHSRVLSEANSNYGNNIILWDLVFGSYHNPVDCSATSDVGLNAKSSPVPENYIAQLLFPFKEKAEDELHLLID